MINYILYLVFKPVMAQITGYVLTFMRIAIGLLTIGHGIPKMGGPKVWNYLGTIFMNPLGIRFLPTMWGFMAGCTEFFGGVALVLGLGTRVASFFLIIMMVVATLWHFKRGDGYDRYSFPMTMIVIFSVFMIIGSGPYSLDKYLF